MGRIERTYGRLFGCMIFAISPLKKAVVNTPCTIHKFINIQSLEILKNDGFLDAYSFFYDFILQLNEGVTWADQDFKSTGHFYSPSKQRGLYGNSNALALATRYYNDAIKYWKMGDMDTAIFYLGAAIHLVQDMTVPQHANIRLLDDHRKYENFIRRVYQNSPKFIASKGGYYLRSVDEYIHCNARTAVRIYEGLKKIEDDEERFFVTTKFTLPLAQKTTAGCLMMFYKDTLHKRI